MLNLVGPMISSLLVFSLIMIFVDAVKCSYFLLEIFLKYYII